jgi:hypothetical protein
MPLNEGQREGLRVDLDAFADFGVLEDVYRRELNAKRVQH